MGVVEVIDIRHMGTVIARWEGVAAGTQAHLLPAFSASQRNRKQRHKSRAKTRKEVLEVHKYLKIFNVFQVIWLVIVTNCCFARL